jgi:DNA-directed RNA polymerase subunit N (RpoN/RPB10)
MEIRCHDCGSKQFRRSRIRLKDLKKLLVLKYPVRCYSCYARGYAPVFAVFSGDRKPMKRPAT